MSIARFLVTIPVPFDDVISAIALIGVVILGAVGYVTAVIAYPCVVK